MFPIGNAEKNQLVEERAENKYYTYNTGYVIDINDKSDAKALIANRVKKKAKCLDVGCGVGYLGEMLSDYRNAEVYGVELDEEATKWARKRKKYRDVYNFSITEHRGKEYERFIKAKLKFDYIIFADLIEHIIAPEEVLLFFSKFLKLNGKILVSLPNIAHFDIIRGLMDGEFNYNHVGLLDNTHLRFYTKNSFEQLIEQVNKVFDQKFAIRVVDKTIAVPDYIGDYKALYNILNQDGEACVLQYIYEIDIRKSKGGILDKKNSRRFSCKIEKGLSRQEELEREVKDLRSSTSWKITKPIRTVSAVLKKK